MLTHTDGRAGLASSSSVAPEESVAPNTHEIERVILQRKSRFLANNLTFSFTAFPLDFDPRGDLERTMKHS